MTQLDISAIEKAFSQVENLEQLENLYSEYFGKQGIISQANKELGTLSPEEKKVRGQEIQQQRQAIQKVYDEKKVALQQAFYTQAMENDPIDWSLSYAVLPEGTMHLVQKERRRVEDILTSLGFSLYYGHDVVTKYENFVSVNIPETHPATEMHDTLFLHQQDENGKNLILRTHTSAMQNEIMKKMGAPLRAAIPGKVYRNENVDASHDMVFWQLEGLVIDKNISIAHFKELMTNFLSAVLEKDTKIRMRPAFFPFVEPGFEIDAACPICEQKGCPLCKKTGWIEILGAGMIHPNVLTEGNIDPNEYTGYAFGIGLTRLVAVKYGIKDIRFLTNGDLKFLQSVGK